jgi:hypothetical protein
MEARVCKRCGETKESAAFVFNRTARSGGNICKPCRNKREVENRKVNPENYRRWWRQWAENNRDRARQHSRKTDAKLRADVLGAYGGRCECCGEQEKCFLTLDHINGGGTKHRKAVHGKVYAQLRREGYPSGYRVLCWNCNWAHRLTGSCPHKSK